MGGLPIPAPIKVSPTIKLFRWGLLTVGIFYGASRKKSLAKKEVVAREIRKQKAIVREAKINEEKRIASQRDIAMLEALGDPPPGDDEDDD